MIWAYTKYAKFTLFECRLHKYIAENRRVRLFAYPEKGGGCQLRVFILRKLPARILDFSSKSVKCVSSVSGSVGGGESRLYGLGVNKLHIAVRVWQSGQCGHSLDHMHCGSSRQTRGIHPMLFQCWASVEDVGPSLKEHLVNASCLMGHTPFIFYTNANAPRDVPRDVASDFQTHCSIVATTYQRDDVRERDRQRDYFFIFIVTFSSCVAPVVAPHNSRWTSRWSSRWFVDSYAIFATVVASLIVRLIALALALALVCFALFVLVTNKCREHILISD